jgi:hypothetical protein
MGSSIYGNLSELKSIAQCAAAFILPPFPKTNILSQQQLVGFASAAYYHNKNKHTWQEQL